MWLSGKGLDNGRITNKVHSAYIISKKPHNFVRLGLQVLLGRRIILFHWTNYLELGLGLEQPHSLLLLLAQSYDQQQQGEKSECAQTSASWASALAPADDPVENCQLQPDVLENVRYEPLAFECKQQMEKYDQVFFSQCYGP